MTCQRFVSPDGKVLGFVCTSERGPRATCKYCRAKHEFLCDHRDKLKGRRCSRKLCATHAHQVGDDLHVCPDHVAAKPTESDGARQSADSEPFVVCTGHINWHRKDPDALDITWMTGTEGKPFAPTVDIWKAARRALDEAKDLEQRAVEEMAIVPDHAIAKQQEAERIRAKAWAEYRRAYFAEMIVSSDSPVPDDWRVDVMMAKGRGVKACTEAWAALQARKRVVLLCYCPSRDFCHRHLLLQILVRKGAVDGGELPRPEPAQTKLFGT